MEGFAERLLANTSKPLSHPALLVLEDGCVFSGRRVGASGEVFGEICFNTALEGYPEVITDPSYAGQIVVMCYPQIGNYGICADDLQAPRPALRGLVVRDMCAEPSNWRSEESLPEFCAREGIVAIEGVDTRALVQHIRDYGAKRAVISSVDGDAASLLAKVRQSPSLVGENLAAGVSCAEAYGFGAADVPRGHTFAVEGVCGAGAEDAPARYRVVVYDCGAKRSILQQLVYAGCELSVVPWDTPAEEVLAAQPDGVFMSNGPGDPEAVGETFAQVERLLGRVPVFGICLGHQMMALAAGAQIEKLKFGHHGGNHPVMNLMSGRVEITAQNHGFNPVFPSLGKLLPELSGGISEQAADLRFWSERRVSPVVENPRFGRIRLTHVNLNDGTAEGMAFLDIPAFSVQYHPEASPGPTDSRYLFRAFTRMMDAWKAGDGPTDWSEALSIDIAKARLAGWRFASSGSDEGREAIPGERFRTSEPGDGGVSCERFRERDEGREAIP
ncbi:MAG: glutamine-hydrolyzing carbamoyl-phosphate synthase small subunit, partial [Eggerthellaceae bacterium]|nr:glutamine-hydrolyzing carbamoyl-phosphate synthase small subunit [Eggerthellaceae bacterium]